MPKKSSLFKVKGGCKDPDRTLKALFEKVSNDSNVSGIDVKSDPRFQASQQDVSSRETPVIEAIEQSDNQQKGLGD